jgi:hypothetical protein
MPRIGTLDIVQVNKQIDNLDILQSQVGSLQATSDFAAQQVAIADPVHAPATTNNVNFIWTGSAGTLSWSPAFIKDKNWKAQTTPRPAAKSSAPGQQHIYSVKAGSVAASANTYYWLGWDYSHNQMIATQDASELHGNFNIHILGQVFTGTAGQTGTAGGGGSTGGVDLSGSRYKNF